MEVKISLKLRLLLLPYYSTCPAMKLPAQHPLLSPQPSVRITCDGSTFAVVQAEPVAIARMWWIVWQCVHDKYIARIVFSNASNVRRYTTGTFPLSIISTSLASQYHASRLEIQPG